MAVHPLPVLPGRRPRPRVAYCGLLRASWRYRAGTPGSSSAGIAGQHLSRSGQTSCGIPGGAPSAGPAPSGTSSRPRRGTPAPGLAWSVVSRTSNDRVARADLGAAPPLSALREDFRHVLEPPRSCSSLLWEDFRHPGLGTCPRRASPPPATRRSFHSLAVLAERWCVLDPQRAVAATFPLKPAMYSSPSSHFLFAFPSPRWLSRCWRGPTAIAGLPPFRGQPVPRGSEMSVSRFSAPPPVALYRAITPTSAPPQPAVAEFAPGLTVPDDGDHIFVPRLIVQETVGSAVVAPEAPPPQGLKPRGEKLFLAQSHNDEYVGSVRISPGRRPWPPPLTWCRP